MNIMIAGGGKVGRTITRELGSEGHDITLIDLNSNVLEDIVSKYDVISYQGNCASMNSLDEAGVKDCDVFIAATDRDEVNLLACITAKALQPQIHTIARIRDPEYVEQAYTLRDTFNLSLIVNPEKQAANEIARLLKYPGFLQREEFAKAHVEIVEYKVPEKCKLDQVKLMDLYKVVRAQVLVCVVVRDNTVFMPSGDFVIHSGDRLFVTGESDQLTIMLRNIGVITHRVKHVLMAGGSRIAYYLAGELHKSHIKSSIIEIDEKTCKLLSGKLPDTTMIHGDISDHSIMDTEDIEDYDAYVSLTGLDEVNILTSMYANMKQVPQVVTKVSRGTESQLLNAMQIGSVISPKELCTMHIVRYVRAMQDKEGAALTIHKIADGNAEAIEFRVDEHTKHIGEKLKDLHIRKNILINSIRHRHKTEIPNGDSSFALGDTVVVVAATDRVIHQLNDIFEG